jgi:hypothetical protein
VVTILEMELAEVVIQEVEELVLGETVATQAGTIALQQTLKGNI